MIYSSYRMRLSPSPQICKSSSSIMKNVPRSITRVAAFVFGVSISTTVAFPQVPATTTVLLAMAANAKQVVQYEWKQRITVIRKGNPSEPVIDQVRFDSTGQMQRTTISAPEPKRGLRGKIAAGVKEDVKGIMELAGRYNKPQQMIEAVKKSQVSETPGAGTIRLQANDLINPNDSMSMLVSSTTHLAIHVDIKTVYDGGPMMIAQDYSPLPNGPNVMKGMKVSVPMKGLVINIESYDYARQIAQER